METRWMLYLEDGDTLRLFAGAPRAYFKPGATIAIEKAGSYFGALNFSARVSGDGNTITVSVDCSSERRPNKILVRVPHFKEAKPSSVEGGVYDAASETVTVGNFSGRAKVTLRY
jgi:hypothetical protein